MEVPSPVSGELLRIIAQEGETVPMGAPIAEVETQDRQPAASAQPAMPTPAPGPEIEPAAAPSRDTGGTPAVPVAYLIDAQPVGPTGGSAVEALAEADTAAPAPTDPMPAPVVPTVVAPAVQRAGVGKGPNRLSPAVRRLAREHNVDVEAIAGTGMGGRVTRNDVLRHLEAPLPPAQTPVVPVETPAAAPAIAVGADEERAPLTPVRRMIAEAMERSVREIPHAWSMVEVDVSELVALRNRERDGFRQREGVNLTYLPLALKAVAGALKDNPTLNASWGGDHIVLKRRIHLGIAVAAPSGLVVPVIHDADRLSIAGLAHAVDDLSVRARAGNLPSFDNVESLFDDLHADD